MAGIPFAPDSLDTFTVPTITGPTNATSSASPATSTATLTGNGIWVVTVQAKLNGSLDHMMTGAWLTQFYDAATNDSLLSTQIGATSKSAGSVFGLTALTLSAPASGGVLTATATWTNGTSYVITWTFRARRLAPL
jgi:hypothetical protein